MCNTFFPTESIKKIRYMAKFCAKFKLCASRMANGAQIRNKIIPNRRHKLIDFMFSNQSCKCCVYFCLFCWFFFESFLTPNPVNSAISLIKSFNQIYNLLNNSVSMVN